MADMVHLRKVLFVCLGNICRSAMAEAIMKKKLQENGMYSQYFIDSAGTIDHHQGEPADARMIRHARDKDYHITSISRPIKLDDFARFDLIIGMDRNNMIDLERRCPNKKYLTKLHLMTDFLTEHEASLIPDPYYMGDSEFKLVIDLLEDACDGLIKFILSQPH